MDIYDAWAKTCYQLAYARGALDCCEDFEVGDWARAVLMLEKKCLRLEGLLTR